MPPLTQLDLPGIPKYRSGKVREVFDLGDALLIVATDRISAFDCILPTGIPDKGAVLNQLSAFWFDRLPGIVPNHLIATDPRGLAGRAAAARGHAARAAPCWCRKAEVLPVECVVRGYLAGSGWKEYQRHAARLRHDAARRATGRPTGSPSRSSRRRPRRRPGTTRTSPSSEMCRRRSARTWPRRLRDREPDASIATAADYARERGIIIADTKFEFGLVDGELMLIDEVLTPDSSRFWPADEYEPGASPALLRQAVRPRLPGGARLGQDPAGAAAARRRRRAHASEVPRGLPADHGNGTGLTARGGAERDRMAALRQNGGRRTPPARAPTGARAGPARRRRPSAPRAGS